MFKNFQACFITILFGLLVFSLQGCDQIQKFTEYLSPSRKPAQEAVQPEQPVPAAPAQAAAAALVPAAREQSKEIPPNVLAKIGDWSITIGEFNEQLAALQEAGVEGFDIQDAQQKQYILGQLLQQQVLVQAALKDKMDQDAEVVEAVKAFRDTILAQAFVEKLTANISVTDAEVQTFYNENQGELVGPAQWHVKEIVVDTEEKARTVVVELNQGASFEDIARERSIGRTAAQGGDLGMIETFENERTGQIVSALDVGAVSGFFSGPQGFYIVKLVEKREGQAAGLNEIREDLKNYILMMKQQEVVFAALAKVQEDIEIHINEQLLEE